MKRLFGLSRARYFGLAKTHAQLAMAAIGQIKPTGPLCPLKAQRGKRDGPMKSIAENYTNGPNNWPFRKAQIVDMK